MASIRGICLSEKRGTQKTQVQEANLIEEWGIEGDAHAGNWHRQVSILSNEKIEAFKQKGADIDYGAFGENLIIDGYDFRTLPVGTLVKTDTIIMQITQIGKECHDHCEIYKKMGECIMPREGVFARVLKGGLIKIGDTVWTEPGK